MHFSLIILLIFIFYVWVTFLYLTFKKATGAWVMLLIFTLILGFLLYSYLFGSSGILISSPLKYGVLV